MSDWVTEYLGLKPKRKPEPSAPARTDLSRSVPTLVSPPTGSSATSGPGRTFSSDLENLSIGLGRGLTSQLEGIKALVTEPGEVLEGMKQFAGQVIDDPRVLAEMAKEYGIKATSGPLGFGEVVGEMVSPLPRTKVPTAEIRKEPGGNWLPGSIERIISDRKFGEIAPYPADEARGNLKASASAVDSWLETKLTNYIKNDMATERDPVRKGIEQRVAKADEVYARGKERIAKNQKKIAEAKARGQDTTAVEDRLALEMADLEQKYELDKLAASGRLPNLGYNTLAVIANERNMYGKPQLGAVPQSQAWENITDASVDQGVSDFVKKRPWLPDEYIQELDRIPSGSNVYELRNTNEFNDVLGHLTDELYNSIRNDSNIPPELKLKPEDLQKMNMDAVVAHVGKVDAWRERNRAAADLLKSRNAATVTFKEYPGTGLEWKELKMPKGQMSDVDAGTRLLQEALEYEGKVMGHCVGGYCPQVASGKTQIFSLRDAKGEPHVTIEVRPGDTARAVGKLPDEERIALSRRIKGELFGDPQTLLTTLPSAEQDKFYDLIDKAYLEKYGPPPSEIVQIKGKGNKKPADKYVPFVQDFVKSGKWSQIGDYENAGLVALEADNMMIKALERTGSPLPTYDPSIGVNGRYIITPEQHVQLSEWFDKGSKAGFSPPKFADGGRVEEEEYDEDSIEEIVAPLRRRFEQVAGVARKIPRKLKQTAADVTDIGEIISRSKKIPLEYFDPKSEVAGEADAMRHLLFQAQLAQKYGDMPAQMVSYLHEYTSPGQPSAEREMDLYNDILGREIAKKAKSEKELVELARRYVQSGRAKTLPKEQRGGY